MLEPERGVLRLFVGILACCTLSSFDSTAQNYPVKPIRLLVGYPPGGGTDVTARLVAQRLSENLGQPIVVENRPGASGLLAIERVATSPKDGYTLLMFTSNETVLPALRAIPFDLVRDFSPVSLAAKGSYVLVVHPSLPARNVKMLIGLARSQPGKLSFGSTGVGGTPHLAGELFGSMAKVKLLHVAYKGGANATVAAVTGEVDMSFPSITAALPLLGSGKLKPLAVTSARRAPSVPSVPTLDESGLPGYDVSSWFGVVAPEGVPKEIIERLNAEIGKVVNTPQMRKSLSTQSLEPQTNTPEQFASFINSEIMRAAKLIGSTGAKAE